ncbi:hypothetical protein ANASTE_01611 [Anaerofustis stercorihominis DSM 17244]|uniref:Uncharacterized protein n=1 Tax=Anaerofustis stercorihominis DSM 17244 TaxID=445971 RepID=B1C8J7_9FIRM|nr:hypothetical protein ANASTE_01611 [Anaerofustis stercorihominis DSM 17244]
MGFLSKKYGHLLRNNIKYICTLDKYKCFSQNKNTPKAYNNTVISL